MKQKAQKQNFCSLLIISTSKEKVAKVLIWSKIKLPMKNSSSSFNRIINTWMKKREKRAKRLEMCDQNEDRKPGAERRTLAARNAEAGVFVSVVAIFTLHPWHLAHFRCPRGRYPSAAGSPCRAFPTHFSFLSPGTSTTTLFFSSPS